MSARSFDIYKGGRPVAPTSKFIETRSVVLHYLEWPNSRPLVLLLHGRGLCAQVWRATGDSLSSRYHVLAMDLRGHGDSGKPGNYAWENVIRDLKDFVETLDLQNLFLVGHSRGAVVAALGGSLIRDRVRGAVLIEPGIPVPDPLAGSHNDRTLATRIARNRRSVWPNRQAVFERYSKAEAFRHWRADILWDYLLGGMKDLDDGQVELKCTPDIEAQLSAAQAPSNLDKLLRAVNFPIRLITSENPERHPKANPALLQLKEASPRFDHVILKKIGHFIPQEDPVRLETEIHDFIDRETMTTF